MPVYAYKCMKEREDHLKKANCLFYLRTEWIRRPKFKWMVLINFT